MIKAYIHCLFFAAAVLFSNAANCLTGTWISSNSKVSGGVLMIYQEESGAKFQLECYNGPPSYNSGYIDGHMVIQGQVGRFTSDDPQCKITFKFKNNIVVVTQEEDGDCGFGGNVYADGIYKLKNSMKPEFNKGDPRENDSE